MIKEYPFVGSAIQPAGVTQREGGGLMLIAEGWYTVFQMPQIAVVMGCLIPIAAAIGSFWYKGQKVRSENNLKQSMVERGMSAEEIERVMSSSPKRD